MTKYIAMYGQFVRYEKEKERRWVTRVDGCKAKILV